MKYDVIVDVVGFRGTLEAVYEGENVRDVIESVCYTIEQLRGNDCAMVVTPQKGNEGARLACLEEFDKTLTQEEVDAPTFLEWSDATLARGVRTLAAVLHDSVGFHGITGMAAGLALEKVARDNRVPVYNITIGESTRITVQAPVPEGH